MGQKQRLNKLMVENLPNLMKDIKLQIQELLQTTCRIVIAIIVINAHYKKFAENQ